MKLLDGRIHAVLVLLLLAASPARTQGVIGAPGELDPIKFPPPDGVNCPANFSQLTPMSVCNLAANRASNSGVPQSACYLYKVDCNGEEVNAAVKVVPETPPLRAGLVVMLGGSGNSWLDNDFHGEDLIHDLAAAGVRVFEVRWYGDNDTLIDTSEPEWGWWEGDDVDLTPLNSSCNPYHLLKLLHDELPSEVPFLAYGNSGGSTAIAQSVLHCGFPDLDGFVATGAFPGYRWDWMCIPGSATPGTPRSVWIKTGQPGPPLTAAPPEPGGTGEPIVRIPVAGGPGFCTFFNSGEFTPGKTVFERNEYRAMSGKSRTPETTAQCDADENAPGCSQWDADSNADSMISLSKFWGDNDDPTVTAMSANGGICNDVDVPDPDDPDSAVDLANAQHLRGTSFAHTLKNYGFGHAEVRVATGQQDVFATPLQSYYFDTDNRFAGFDLFECIPGAPHNVFSHPVGADWIVEQVLGLID